MGYSETKENDQLFHDVVRKGLTAADQLWSLKHSPSPNKESCLLLSSRHYEVNKTLKSLGEKKRGFIMHKTEEVFQVVFADLMAFGEERSKS